MTKSNFNASSAHAIKLCLAAIATLSVLSAASAQETMTRVIVHYRDGGLSNAQTAVVGARGNVKHHIFGMNAMAVEVTAAGMKQLKNNRHVALVEEDVRRFPLSATTPSTGSPYQVGQLVPYGIHLVQADQMPSGDSLAANRKICIVDSGYDRSHPDLNGNNVTGEYDSGTGWWYTDENDHGSHVAGTISAINNSGVGVVGVNPNKQIKLHIVKVFNAAGWAYSSTLVTAINKCAAAGANVISMSLGGPSYSAAENTAFAALAKKNILSIAAAGNDGGNADVTKATALSYPAGYASVMSVAALDENKQWANFSQYNSKVEIAGPGVNVLSTVPVGKGSLSSLTVAGAAVAAGDMTGSPKASATAALADFGLGDVVNTAVAGKICLIARGTIDFATKVTNCKTSGGVGAIVYNNVAGALGGTLGTTVTTIPSVTASDTDGALLKTKLGQSTTVAVTATNYSYFDGTSMATPHVSGVAALVWSYFPTCTAAQMRISLDNSALDVGAVGRDVKFGYGLVQARAAYDRIKSKGCGK
jgi:subtilisin family serine protease